MPSVQERSDTVPARRYERERRARAQAEAIAEKSLRALYERARELEEALRNNEELEQFAYVASHDLQEPLRMIASYCQLIERRYADVVDDEGREFIAYAVDGASRMQALINDLLAYSRVGRQEHRLEAVSTAAILANVRINLLTAIEESGAVLVFDELPAVLGDASQLTRLFQNLIGNAIKFHGAEAPAVTIGARPGETGWWVFSVADNGIGIERRHAERVFAIFQRLHSRQEYPGTGIGLAVCRKIVERHGGHIWLESIPGEGTTFLFTLPAVGSEVT